MLAHGGRIWIEGTPGGGTAVVFELPVRDAAPVPQEVRRTGRTLVTRVLVVDDEPQIRRAMRTSLEAHGYEVRTVGTGEEAVVAAAEDDPELVLLDLGLPDLDGTDVIRRVRSFSEVPIIVLSVRDRQADKVAALDAGADDYVTKPFGVEEVLARLRAALRRSQAGEPSPPVLRFGELEVDLGRRLVTVGELARAPDEDRVRAARGVRDEPREAPDPPVAAAEGVGTGVRAGEPLPPRVRAFVAPQARGRGFGASADPDRAGGRLSVDRGTGRGDPS